MKTLLALAASPRRGGNSDLALEAFCRAALEAGWQVDMVYINDLKIAPCQACDACAADGKCIISDDMNVVYEKVKRAAALVVAGPITFGTVNAQLKALIDRFQCWWHAKYNLKLPFVPEEENRPGFFICLGALKRKSFCENAAAVVRVLFHNINYHDAGSISFRGYDEKGALGENPAALEEAYQAGKQFISMAGEGRES